MTADRSEFIVRTKLRMPRPARLIPRTRLLSRLGTRLSPFTLVSAPPGFGKTTLVIQLPALRREAVAWYQIDRLDSDPRRFVAHLIAAVQEVFPDFGREHLDEVLRREVGAGSRDIVRFANAIGDLDRPLVLVLDDFHEIDEPAVHGLLARLLEHQPPGLSVVMATRAEPPLPLARFRVRGRITEVGSEDLRFDDEEAFAFVREGLALDLEESLVAALNQRTEGWVAGLQLAGLSLRDVRDPASFIETFDGRERLVTDYLIQEVLEVQPPETRRFLLATSILDRMNASLSAAVSEVADGQRLLEHLERQNLFVVALDRRREWYRYHHLFGDLLRRQLALQDPELLKACHARASDWYTAHGSFHEAMEHALAIPDDERAAALLEQEGWRLIKGMESRQVSSFANRIAEPALARNLDRLAISLAADILIGNAVNRRWIDCVEALIRTDGEGERGHANLLAWARASVLARERRYAEAARWLSGMTETDDSSGNPLLLRSLPPLGRATAAYWERDLERGAGLLEDAMRAALEAGAGSMFFPAALNLFDVFRLRGDAEAAARVLERASLQARQAGWAGTLGVGWLRFAEAESFYASNDLDAAAVAYRDAIDATRFAGSNTVPLLAAMRLAMIAHLRGDRAGALVMANEVAETAHRPNASFVVGMYTPMRTHMWLVLGNLDQAERDLTSLGLAPGDEVGGALEHDYIELARWYVARRRASSVRSMLGEMRRAAEAGGRTRSAVEIQILQALARQQEGDLRQAGTLLESALRTAAGFRDRRIFLDAGPGVAPLLQRVRRQRQVAAEVKPLLDALCGYLGAADAAGLGPRASEPQVEPLSRQEVEVLRMLGGGYSNREIGGALFISVNTVKTHLRHIYAKLGVRTRTAAISRAAALRLLEL